MQTIVEPKQHIDKLWGKQRIREDATYRLMKYVLRVDHDGKVLLHNVVTGRLVVLDQDEAEALEQLPKAYSTEMEQLVTEHYLVPEDYDEHQQVVNLRHILWKIIAAYSSNDITYYTILPTTACNARCWYCYEKDIIPITMTEKTANDLIAFIVRRCGGNPVKIRWFGGEPTIATERIDQISQGLRDNGITYTSNITSNGYLFDEEMVHKAKVLWNTKQVNISIDGIEDTYNQVKAFTGISDNPYQRMMKNVELMMKNGINVVIRMNYDRVTWTEFPNLLKETENRFRNYNHWMVTPHQINGNVPANEWKEMEEWLSNKNVELFDMAETYGNYRNRRFLPSLHFIVCEAGDDNCVTILPSGEIVSCPEKLGDDQVKGNILHGIINHELHAEWKIFADQEHCRRCFLFPYCARSVNCSGKDRCTGKLVNLKYIKEQMISSYEESKHCC